MNIIDSVGEKSDMLKVLAVISPSKKLDFEQESPVSESTQYRFPKQAQSLIDQLRTKSATDIKTLMKLSDNLAQLNVQRYQAWSPKMTETNSKQAVFAFIGDVYTGLSASTLERPHIEKAQETVRILSGLYGLLRPLDRIQPYRLEMGTALKTEQASNLYGFWGEQITQLLNKDLKHAQADILLNLASQEYFKAVQVKDVSARVITPLFKDEKNGEYKIISFFAKKARGLMVRYILDHDLKDINDLKAFDYAGYQFCETRSSENDWVFIRDEQK
ncbi:peroxide stress protein YaaA [Reinekea sp.]|uniref:peroxide stress protein YaaA n=1 Tax=Reinekea sp. TaxID=1970455 RepID=UPI003988C08F